MSRRTGYLQRWLSKHFYVLLRIGITVIFFLLPFVRLVPLSAVQPNTLKIEEFPPGYPGSGGQWTIVVWRSQGNYLTWIPVQNATVVMETSTGANYSFQTDSNGQVVVNYIPSYGKVTFSAYDSLYVFGDSWTPQQTFVSSEVALFIIGFYGLGTPTVFWNLFDKYRASGKHGVIMRGSYLVSVASAVLGGILSLVWFIDWKFGSQWGFGNTILSVGIDIDYYPHLVAITGLLVFASVVLWVGIRPNLALARSRH